MLGSMLIIAHNIVLIFKALNIVVKKVSLA